MTEFENNNDEENNNNENIENFNFAVITIITVVVNAAVNVTMQNFFIEFQESENSQDFSKNEN